MEQNKHTHVIVSFDGSHKSITEETYEKIMKCTEYGLVGLEIEGSFYKLSDMKKVLTNKEFREQYPKKAPNIPQYSNLSLPGPSTTRRIVKDVRKKIKQGFIKSRTARGITKKNAEIEFQRLFRKSNVV